MAVERLDKIGEFFDRIGIMQYYELQSRNIMPDSVIGRFFPNRAAELLEICREQTDLHVISQVGMTDVNHFVPGAVGYFIGDGDSNPTLQLTHVMPTRDEYAYVLAESLKIPELNRSDVERFAIKLMQASLAGSDLLDTRVMTKLINKKG